MDRPRRVVLSALLGVEPRDVMGDGPDGDLLLLAGLEEHPEQASCSFRHDGAVLEHVVHVFGADFPPERTFVVREPHQRRPPALEVVVRRALGEPFFHHRPRTPAEKLVSFSVSEDLVTLLGLDRPVGPRDLHQGQQQDRPVTIGPQPERVQFSRHTLVLHGILPAAILSFPSRVATPPSTEILLSYRSVVTLSVLGLLLLACGGLGADLSGTDLQLQGKPWKVDTCMSGQPLGFRGVFLTSKDSGGVNIITKPDGTAEVVLIQNAKLIKMGNCAQVRFEETSLTVNDVKALRGGGTLDCEANGVTLKGTVAVDRCAVPLLPPKR